MVHTLNPVLRNIVKRNASQGGAGAHGFNVSGKQYSSFGFPDAAQSQAYSMGGYSQKTGQLTSRFYPPAGAPVYSAEESLTYSDIVAKTAICLSLVFCTAVAENMLFHRLPDLGMKLGKAGFAIGFVIVFFRICKSGGSTKPYALGYAVSQGLFVGLITGILPVEENAGLVIGQALLSITGAFVVMLFSYRYRRFHRAPRLNKLLFVALTGLTVAFLSNLVYSLVTGNDPFSVGKVVSIVFSLICVVITSFILITGFDVVQTLVGIDADKEEAWLAALGLTFTLVWLYVELILFLAKLVSSRD